jgi:prolyl-tRNA editing enzyme YbaK/EbsC (Cys-tRNA(Pro) deacylase)
VPFWRHAPDVEVLVTEASSATWRWRQRAHGVEPAQIAKTICLRVGEQTMLIVAGGMSRLDNRKFKDRFGGKPRMLDANEVVAATSHPVGGVCPFGPAGAAARSIATSSAAVAFDEVVPSRPAATNAAVRLSPRSAWPRSTTAEWVDVVPVASA